MIDALVYINLGWSIMFKVFKVLLFSRIILAVFIEELDKISDLDCTSWGELQVTRHQIFLCRIEYLEKKLNILLQYQQKINDTFSATLEK